MKKRFSLPAIMKKILSKMKVLKWSQDFLHFDPFGDICCHGNQSSDPIKRYAAFPPPQMKFDFDRPAGFRDIHV